MMPNGDWYFGNWIMGEFIKGLARETWPSGNSYVGSFNNRKMDGYGEFTWKTKGGKKYSGMWKDGKMHGVGKMEWNDGRMVYR